MEASGQWKGFRTYAQSASLEDDRFLDTLPSSYFPLRTLIERSFGRRRVLHRLPGFVIFR